MITIVVVTAMPYAAAKFEADLKPSTNPMQAIIRNQLMVGT